MKNVEDFVGQYVLSAFISTPALVQSVNDYSVTVRYRCNGKTRSFYKSLFLSHNPSVIDLNVHEEK